MSLPNSLLDSLTHVKGFDRSAFERIHTSGEQVTSIRTHPQKFDKHKVYWVTESIPWCPFGSYLSERPFFTFDPLFHAGAYYVQEASSMFLWHAVAEIFGNDTHKKVLDLCAAPGGKSTLLASFFKDGLVVANEVIKQRAAILVENATKWGMDNLVVTNNDPSHFQSIPAFFDLIVVDAPCSGSGLFRKDPEAIDEWSEGNVQLCSQRQQRILADVLPALNTEGILIYSTCSYSELEDEMIADWLVEEMGMESIRIPIDSSWGIIETESGKHKAFGYRFFPNLVKGEGFYISAYRKKQLEDTVRIKETKLTLPSRSELEMIRSFLTITDQFTFFKQIDTVRVFPEKWFNELQQLAQCLYIKKAGIAIGVVKGKDVIPDHEIAVSILPKNELPSFELNNEQALQYLRRKDLVLPDAPKGWCLLQYSGLPLGWAKVLPNRLNNYYPGEWRILKE